MIIATLWLSLLAGVPAPASIDAPPELGKIRWERDYARGLAESRRTGKPVFLLFTEVPGCATVNAFARQVLSDPRVVALAEGHFVPVAVFNNVGGADRRVLERWKEPAWANPVMRFIDADERELHPRLTHVAGVPGTLRALRATLDTAR